VISSWILCTKTTFDQFCYSINTIFFFKKPKKNILHTKSIKNTYKEVQNKEQTKTKKECQSVASPKQAFEFNNQWFKLKQIFFKNYSIKTIILKITL
jgi:hypothetical protein